MTVKYSFSGKDSINVSLNFSQSSMYSKPFRNNKRNLLMSSLENVCYHISFSKFLSNFFLQFLLQPRHFYSFCIFQIAFTIFLFNSTHFTFFVIMHIFTFNFMNSARKTTDKICVCHKSFTINIRVRNTKKVIYFSVFSPKQLNCSSNPSTSLFMI